jgi:Protein of unknown function (DUF2851)
MFLVLKLLTFTTTHFCMTEKLLQFIWQFQHYNKNELHTEDGEPLQIVKPGILNHNQGADFLQASIKIGNIILAGNIELHINTTDWNKHKHSSDANYSNIILHVVWQHDGNIKVTNSNSLPTLVLQNRVAKVLLQRYQQLMDEPNTIACQPFLPALSSMGWLAWKERLAAERLEQKSKKVLELYQQSNHHWEEVFWWMLAANFGIKVNAAYFLQLAQSISVNIIAKHKNQIHQLEALLLGQANLLQGSFEEDYPKLLQKEYQFLQKKYSLQTLSLQPAFLRMRPAAFPTVRLVLLAMLVKNSSHLFSKVKALQQLAEVKQLLNVTANDYWHYHYRFDEITVYKPKNLGETMIDNIIINTIIPVLFAYGLYSKEEEHKDKAIRWLQELAPEQNNITKSWKTKTISNDNALDSQALIQLTNCYCKEKLCLKCAVGNKIVKD